MKEQLTYATGLVRPKTTALFFEKLWIPDEIRDHVFKSRLDSLNVPKEISLSHKDLSYEYEKAWYAQVPSPIELVPDDRRITRRIQSYQLIENTLELKFLQEIEGEKLYYTRSYDIEKEKDFVSVLLGSDRQTQFDFFSFDEFGLSTFFRNRVLEKVVKEYKKIGLEIVPIYLVPAHFNNYSNTSNSKEIGIQVCLDFIPDILEDKLSWDQVLDFRNDNEAKQKLKRLRRWFSRDMLNKSKLEVKADIEEKLDNYKWALKKHGIETVIGGCTSILAASTAPEIIRLLSDSSLSSVAGGLAVAGGALAWAAKKSVDRLDLQRDEVAYIYEVEKLAQK